MKKIIKGWGLKCFDCDDPLKVSIFSENGPSIFAVFESKADAEEESTRIKTSVIPIKLS